MNDEIAEFLAKAFTAIPMSMHYITNIEAEVDDDTATVRAMFYNPTQLPGLAELSFFGGYYAHELVRTANGWRSRHLCEEGVWSVNARHP